MALTVLGRHHVHHVESGDPFKSRQEKRPRKGASFFPADAHSLVEWASYEPPLGHVEYNSYFNDMLSTIQADVSYKTAKTNNLILVVSQDRNW